MRKYYLLKQKSHSLSDQLSWTHYRTLLTLDDIKEINYYVYISKSQNLSVRQLQERIKSKEYERIGYKAELEIVGVGYRVSNQGNVITFELLHSHSIVLVLPSEIKVETKSERNKNPLITLESCDKQLLGQVCAKIRSFRKPEPYKGKGIKFVGEVIRRKSGKSAAAK